MKVECLGPDCGKTPDVGPYCKGHYTQQYVGRPLTPILRGRSRAYRFKYMYDVDPETGCWNWGKYVQHGYGVYTERGCNMRAHRVSYELYVGPLVDGLVVDHLCRNKVCVNPDHLRQVTQAENTYNRGVTGTGPLGVRNVTLSPWGTYQVAVTRDGKRHYIGSYKTLEDAASAAADARQRIYGG